MEPNHTLAFSRGEMIAQCAEAKVFHCDFYGLPAVCKHRFEKAYRHPKLDLKIREQRTTREARALSRCALAKIHVPTVYAVNKAACEIVMQRVEGEQVKAVLDRMTKLEVEEERMRRQNANEEEKDDEVPLPIKLIRGIGETVGQLHNLGMVHGDLTTSNFLAVASPPSPPQGESGGDRHLLAVIDFGLVAEKSTAEDRAVDLYVLLRAFTSTHPHLEDIAEEHIVKGYRQTVMPKAGDATLARLEVVRARGRKRSMVG